MYRRSAPCPRLPLVERVVTGLSKAAVAAPMACSHQAMDKCVKPCGTERLRGLRDSESWPLTSPTRTPVQVVLRIFRLQRSGPPKSRGYVGLDVALGDHKHLA